MAFFKKLAWTQYHFSTLILVLTLVLTFFFLNLSQETEFEADMMKEFPQDNPAFEVRNYINGYFNGVETVLVTIKIDDSVVDNPIKSVTDSKVIRAVYDLDGFLREERKVIDTKSIGMVFKLGRLYPLSNEVVDLVLDQAGSVTSTLISDDYKSMIVTVSSDALESKDDITNFVSLLNDKIDRANFPYGVEVKVTGNSILQNELLTYLQNDFFKTILISLLLITSFIFLIKKNMFKTIVIVLPLVFGLIWFGGLVNLFNLKLSVSTVATGAMILGLGVEYTIFIYQMFNQSMAKHNDLRIDDRIKISLSESVEHTGKSIFGSAMTTIAAFLSLNFSGIPMISHLGTISALGIVSLLILSVFVYPAFFVFISRMQHHNLVKND